ncbi:hypothetical protein ACIRQY_24555 [Streptomyces sp. NPDC101490]|uniref:hypothetical protein n=1 Tax=unclassified Streptomyces TaxID=2593676 RepID=UPI0033333640
MILLALTGVLLLAVAGCVCVVWAAQGGPRWVQAVSAVTLGAGRLVRSRPLRGPNRSSGNDITVFGDGGSGGGGDSN